MFSEDVVSMVRARVRAVTGVDLPYAVEVSRGEGLRVALAQGRAHIAAQDENALARGFFRLSRCVREGKTALDVRERRHFAACGAMIDCSRGAVLTVQAAQRMIDRAACLGMNLMMLYTEDTYETPEYPYLGYLRGRYTQEELRTLDAYAAQMGVELVPCIQTLGHMRQFLQWSANAGLRDQGDILLADEEQTYALIEAQIRAMRGCVRSGRIHIGMDEAHGVGLGEYLLRHGQTDRFALLCRHLNRVTEICTRYGFRPIMWSDMFFRLGSRRNDYYDPDSDVPQAVIEQIPQVDLCYWDYYHDDPALYDHMLAQHARMGGRTVYAGGIWTWSGFLPHVKQTERTMRPALAACVRHGVDTVIATMWGDDGAETNPFLAAGLLPLFSEVCWQGADCAQEEAALAGECLTGLPCAALEAMGAFYPDAQEPWTGKGLIWCDPLYPLMNVPGDTPQAAQERMRPAMNALRALEDNLECRFAAQAMDVAIEKACLVREMRERYLARDRAWLRETAHVDMKRLLGKYAELMRLHRALWERDMKRSGWEVLCLRYGAVMGRLEDAADEIRRYLAGELPCIEALEEEPQSAMRGPLLYAHLVTPSAALGTGF